MIKEYTALGLMSGTSGDGVDASIVKSDGSDNYKVILNKYFKYSLDISNGIYELKEKINNKKDLTTLNLELNSIEEKITLFHAESSKNLLQDNNVDVVGFHGQTIYHNPKEKISFQLGNGNLLSQLSKKKIVFNFRKNDIENGGEGAPLTPIFHKYLVISKKIELPVCILNIGGISNLTLIHSFKNHEILSQDVGPGNCLINSWIQSHTKEKFDKGGKVSNRGKINELILEQSLETHEHNFKKKDNISLDTNDFDISFARGLNLEDGAATLTAFSAKIITSKINFLLKDNEKKNVKIIICGGGRKNISLIKQIKLNSKRNLSFYNSEDYGLNGDFIESQAFGYIAIRSILSLPISFPLTTGCSAPCTGGVLVKI